MLNHPFFTQTIIFLQNTIATIVDIHKDIGELAQNLFYFRQSLGRDLKHLNDAFIKHFQLLISEILTMHRNKFKVISLNALSLIVIYTHDFIMSRVHTFISVANRDSEQIITSPRGAGETVRGQ